MMEAIRSSETSVLTTATRLHLPEGYILNSHRSKNLKSKIKTHIVSDYNYYNSRHYVSSCLIIETHCSGDWILSMFSGRDAFRQYLLSWVKLAELVSFQRIRLALSIEVIRYVEPEDGDRLQSPK
jgi:hypothetical protein